MTDKIKVERHGPVTVLRLDDLETMNALTSTMALELRDLLLLEAQTARAIVLAGSSRAFSAGANLKQSKPESRTELDAGAALENAYNPLMTTIRDLPVPVVSAVQGAVAGIGASLALACDVIVAGRDAYFLEAFARIGLIPDGGATWLLTRAVGRVRAMEMMLLAEKIPAPTAFDWGLVTRLVENDEVEAKALEIATLANGPVRSLALIRKAAWSAADTDFDTALANERKWQKEAGNTPDFQEGVAAFLEKRPPRFNG